MKDAYTIEAAFIWSIPYILCCVFDPVITARDVIQKFRSTIANNWIIDNFPPRESASFKTRANPVV